METRQKIQEIDTKIPELREKNVVNPISKVNVFIAGYKCNSIQYLDVWTCWWFRRYALLLVHSAPDVLEFFVLGLKSCTLKVDKKWC